MSTLGSIKFGKMTFPRNGVLASGILGVTGASMAQAAKSGAGGVTSKSISLEEREGHPTPVIQMYKAGMINAVGLSSTGVENSNKELAIVKQKSDAKIIASIFGATAYDFKETVKALDKNNIDAIEVNISCPNVEDEFGLPFASSPKSAALVTRYVREETNLPVIIKLSPNFQMLGDIAKAVETEGADGITAINTVGPGMLIDINTHLPKITNKTGGVSGPAILPIAIRCIYEIYKSVKIPIIGMGGVISIEDALQVIMAGATLYGVGTGVVYEGLDIFKKINKGIDDYLNKKKMKYTDIIGIAHKV